MQYNKSHYTPIEYDERQYNIRLDTANDAEQDNTKQNNTRQDAPRQYKTI